MAFRSVLRLWATEFVPHTQPKTSFHPVGVDGRAGLTSAYPVPLLCHRLGAMMSMCPAVLVVSA